MKEVFKTLCLLSIALQNINLIAQFDSVVSTNPYTSQNDNLPDLNGRVAPYVQDQRFLNGVDGVAVLKLGYRNNNTGESMRNYVYYGRKY